MLLELDLMERSLKCLPAMTGERTASCFLAEGER
jgi:hypothetical protein